MSAIGIDYGAVRIGVAREIPDIGLVIPVSSVSPSEILNALRSWTTEFEIDVIYIGLPISLSGKENSAAKLVRDWAQELKKIFSDQSIYLVDERLTSVAASQKLGEIGKSTRQQKDMIDAQAAVQILEYALNLEKLHGRPVGEKVE